MKNSITHIGTLHAKPGQIDNLIKSLEGLKKTPGYLTHKCYKDIEDKNKIILVEKWKNKEAHQNFINSFSKDEMTNWMSMLAKEPEDSYYDELS